MPTTEQVQLIPLAKLHVSEHNTRQPKTSEPSIKELAKSLKAEQKTPILVRPHPSKKGHYEIAAGARRYTAACAAELKALKAIVREYDDATFEETILTENLQREDPDPLAEAILLRRLIDRGQSLKEIAAALGKSDTWATRRAKLANLHPQLLEHWRKGDLTHFSAAMIEPLAALPEAAQEQVAESLKRYCHGLEDAESRTDVENYIFRQITNRLNVPWLEDPRTFVENCGPGCTHDSSKQGKLFDEGGKKEGCGNCLNASCFLKRQQLYIDAEYDRLCAEESLPVVAHDSVTIKGAEYKRVYDYTATYSETPRWEDDKKVLLYENGALTLAYTSSEKSGRQSGEKESLTPEKKQENKTKTLQGKRWIRVREKLLASLEASPLGDLTVPIDHLIAVFGLPFREESLATTPVDEGLWNYIHNPNSFPIRDDSEEDKYGYKHTRFGFTGEDAPTREHALWPSVRKILVGLMPMPHRVSDAPAFAETYREIAKLISFPIEAEKYAADIEIPPPKSWGKVDPHTLEAIA
jgi:ParB/RepB/Spo0J family partition protein